MTTLRDCERLWSLFLLNRDASLNEALAASVRATFARRARAFESQHDAAVDALTYEIVDRLPPGKYWNPRKTEVKPCPSSTSPTTNSARSRPVSSAKPSATE
jgi:hypothetical protein